MNKNDNIQITSPETVDRANYVVNVTANGYIHAEVANPEQYTQEELDSIRWVAQMIITKRPNFTSKHFSNTIGPKIRVRFPKIFAGGGYAWLEAVVGGQEPTNELPNGYFIASKDDKAIQKIEWREFDKNKKGALITSEKYFGQAVQLHIYTKGLYAHKLKVQLKDHDKFVLDPDDDLYLDNKSDNSNELAKQFTRQIGVLKHVDDPEKLVQKTVINVQLERRWAASAGNNLSIYPIITPSVKGVSIQGLQIPELKVTQAPENELVHSPLSKSGNQPVVIGSRVTDVAHFHPCRFETITYKLGTEAATTLFSTKNGINIPGKEIAIGTIAHTNSSKQLSIKIETIDTEDCNLLGTEKEHEATLLYTQNLELQYPDAKITQTPTSAEVSFIPQYSYEHLGEDEYLAFFLSYFPIALGSNIQQRMQLPVTTCAFAKDISIEVFPDVAFAYHLQIGKPQDYTDKKKLYYRGIDIEKEFTRGLKKDIEKLKKGAKEVGAFLKYMPNNVLNPYVREIILSYVESEAENFAAALHGYHSFTDTNVATTMDYGKQYPWIPKTYIISGVVISAAIDALLIYLTRGKSAQVKAVTTIQKIKRGYKTYRKIKRYDKAINKLISGKILDPARPNFTETKFIWPQIAASRGIGYIQNPNGTIGLELIERVDAAPLFAMEHSVKGTLGSLVASFVGINKVFDTAEQAVGVAGLLTKLKKDVKGDAKKAKSLYKKEEDANETATPAEGFSIGKLTRVKDLQVLLDAIEKRIQQNIDKTFKEKLGTEAALAMEFIGFYSAHYEFRFDVAQQLMHLDIYNEAGTKTPYSSGAQLSFGDDKGIAIKLEVKASSVAEQKWSKLNDYTPDFLNLNDTKVNASVEGEIAGSIVFERTFTYKKKQLPTSTDVLIFTGVKGKLKLLVKVEVKKDKSWTKKKEINVSKKDKNEKPEGIEFDLIPGFTINFDDQPVFDKILIQNIIQ